MVFVSFFILHGIPAKSNLCHIRETSYIQKLLYSFRPAQKVVYWGLSVYVLDIGELMLKINEKLEANEVVEFMYPVLIIHPLVIGGHDQHKVWGNHVQAQHARKGWVQVHQVTQHLLSGTLGTNITIFQWVQIHHFIVSGDPNYGHSNYRTIQIVDKSKSGIQMPTI